MLIHCEGLCRGGAPELSYRRLPRPRGSAGDICYPTLRYKHSTVPCGTLARSFWIRHTNGVVESGVVLLGAESSRLHEMSEPLSTLRRESTGLERIRVNHIISTRSIYFCVLFNGVPHPTAIAYCISIIDAITFCIRKPSGNLSLLMYRFYPPQKSRIKTKKKPSKKKTSFPQKTKIFSIPFKC